MLLLYQVDWNSIAVGRRNLHSTMLLLYRTWERMRLIRYSFTFHYASTLSRPPFPLLLSPIQVYFLSTPFLHSSPLKNLPPPTLQNMNFPWYFKICLSHGNFPLSQVDNHKKLLVLSSSTPQNSLGIHFSFLHLNTISESLSSRITLLSSIFNFKSCASETSPSKTEFCICIKYFLQVLNVFDNTFAPPWSLFISYTNITYITIPAYHHISKGSYTFSPKRCFTSL